MDKLIMMGVSSLLATSCGQPLSKLADGEDKAESIFSTGLYQKKGSLKLADGVESYEPSYQLWTDGAAKKRWIYLPKGTKVNTKDFNRWIFPKGTKVWKEFSFQGKRVETRLIEKTQDGSSVFSWSFKSYRWNKSETDAELAPRGGIRNVAQTGLGVTHDIPSVNDCVQCHETGIDAVIGFDAIQLVDLQKGLSLKKLLKANLLSDKPAKMPLIPARNDTEKEILGYLHANCGSCHNPMARGGLITGLNLRHEVGRQKVTDLSAVRTTVNALTRFYVVPGRLLGINSRRIEKGKPDTSAMHIRLKARGGYPQMPPIGTKVADKKAVALMEKWIKGL